MTDRFAYPTSLRAGFLAGFQPALNAGRRGQYATVSVAIGGPRLRCAEGGDARLAAIRAFDRAAPPGRSGATGSALAGPARSARSGPPVFAGTSKDGERRSVRTDHWKDTRSRGHSEIESQTESTGATLKPSARGASPHARTARSFCFIAYGKLDGDYPARLAARASTTAGSKSVPEQR